MTAYIGYHNQFTTQPGQGDTLEEILLAAAEGMRTNDSCLLYLVSRSPEDSNVVWVTEAWTSEQASRLIRDPLEESQKRLEIPDRLTGIEREVAAREDIHHPVAPLLPPVRDCTPPRPGDVGLQHDQQGIERSEDREKLLGIRVH